MTATPRTLSPGAAAAPETSRSVPLVAARPRARRTALPLAAAAVAAALAGCGSTTGPSADPGQDRTPAPTLSSGARQPAQQTDTAASPAPTDAATSAGTTAAAFTGTCGFTASQDAGGKDVGLPPAKPPVTSGTEKVTMVTSAGTIVFTMDAGKTPCTAESFAYLASKHFFDGTRCHRLTTQGIFVLQCGDPAGNGTGGPGYTIPDENLTDAQYPTGTVAMANTGSPHTGGSQFFLNYKTSALPPQYTPFGTITQGLDVLQRIAAAGTADGSPDGAPKTPVTVSSFTVSR